MITAPMKILFPLNFIRARAYAAGIPHKIARRVSPPAIKNELIKGLLEIFQGDISMIILYGSVARNEAGPESDIDIAIIMKKDMDEDRKDRFISWSADMDIRYDRVFSIVDIREDNMKKWVNVLPFYRNVQEEGVVLWKAA